MAIFNKAFDNNSVLGSLPAFMFDSALMGGQVPSGCQLRSSLPGMPLMCNPVHPGFLEAIRDLYALTPATACYGSNSVATMAEDTIDGVLYVAAYTKGKIYAMANDRPLSNMDELPIRMLVLLSMPFYLKDTEFAATLQQFQKAATDDEKKLALATLYDNAYMREGDNEIGQSYETTNLLRMTRVKAQNPSYMPTAQEGAQFSVFKNVGTNAATGVAANIVATQSVMKGSEFNGAFRVVEESELTPEERLHIKRIDDRYNITEQHIDVASTIKNSLNGPHPFCNYLFRGQPGGGKSTFVQIIAAGLGLPYYSDVLKDDLSGDFFSGYYAPDVDNKGKKQYKSLEEFLAEMPTPEDMAFDPISAYETITGNALDNVTPKDCMDALTMRIVEFTKNAKSDNKNALTFVEGLIPKLERPCLIFYDEVTAPKNPGAITALNSLMDRQRVFTLSTGRVIHRHPLSVMCFAGNFSEDGVELEGVHDPNRTWQDRNNEVLNIAPPKPAETKAMLIADTGYDEKANANIPIDQFVNILPELQQISADYYGVCGFRALSDWLAKSMAIGSPIRAAETTIITKSTNDPICQAELRQKIKNHFTF